MSRPAIPPTAPPRAASLRHPARAASAAVAGAPNRSQKVAPPTNTSKNMHFLSWPLILNLQMITMKHPREGEPRSQHLRRSLQHAAGQG